MTPFHGHLGVAYRDIQVQTDGDLWYYGQLAGEPTPNRYWNAFGLSQPHPSNIIVEINFPICGVNRSISGMLAQETSRSELYILHRGNVGGGRKGIGKKSFLEWYVKRSSDKLVKFEEPDGRSSSAVRVACFNKKTFHDELQSFIHDVSHYKEEVVHPLHP